MRLLYIDIDSLRPDHLGCYGYRRDTSPNIDELAAGGIRFERVYASDTPCLPSRTALVTGRFGIHNGVVGHGGTAAQLKGDGERRGFADRLSTRSFPALLRRAGMATATITTFAERHSAWHWYAGFQSVFNLGTRGLETADQVLEPAQDWIRRNAAGDGWFLHVNLWDPHTPYRTPEVFGDPFRDEPLPQWLTEDVRRVHWARCGPHSAREVMGFVPATPLQSRFPRQPTEMASMLDVRRMFDGYDAGVRFADEHVGRMLNALADAGVLEETAVMVSADHGENLGELNVYGDHQTADEVTSRLPLVLRWPGAAPRVDRALHYQVDVAATLVELAGTRVSRTWDGRSFAGAFERGVDDGRPYLVVSHGAWSCQRAVRFERYLLIRTYHDGYHDFRPVMLFDVDADPHETTDVSDASPDVVHRGLALLDEWYADAMAASDGTDPMWTVMREGGPFHTKSQLPAYLDRLRATGRGDVAERLAAVHPGEAAG